MGDSLLRTLSRDGHVRVTTLVGTELAREAARRHGTGPVATAALARALQGAVLLAADGKAGETVQLQFRGDGPLRAVTAIADPEGRVRGYVAHPDAPGAPEVGRALGAGKLAVVRFRPTWRQPYTGIVELRSGEIAQELAHYLLHSEQRPTAVGLGVWLDPEVGVGAAGGFLVEALPGADPESVAQVEENTRGLSNPSVLVREGAGVSELAERLLLGLGGTPLERRSPRFHCGCDRERVRRAAALLGRREVASLRASGETLEVRCEFCGERYRVTAEEIPLGAA